MKKILSLVAILLTTLAVVAQNNPVITYQAVVRDASNRLVTNKSVTVKVEVLTPSNTPMYTEAEDLFTNANGLLSMVIGDYNPAQFANINWTNAKFATTVTVTSTGYEVKDTIPVSAVPYAITANYADDVNPTGNTIQAIYSKIEADSTALCALINANAVNISTSNQAIIDSSAHIRANLADTAAAIRGDFPTVNDVTLTIQKNGTDVGSFTTNQSTASAVNITVPTNVSELEGIDAYATLSKVQADSLALGTLIDNNKAAIADSSAHIRANLADTAAAIRGDFPTVNNATLTIQKNGTDVGTFTANQSTAGTVNITVPTTVAELTDEDNYAKKAGNNPFSGNNTFSGANDFTSGSITVPNAITNLNTTLNDPCNQNAVNVCDLMAVFDSLNQRIQVLESVLHAVMDNLSYPTVITSQPSDISACKATLRGEIVSSGITNISGRGFYYNTTGEPNFFNGTNIPVSGNEVGDFTYNLTDLSPNTTYYIRTYAIVSTNNNNGNIYYGDVVSFTTLAS